MTCTCNSPLRSSKLSHQRPKTAAEAGNHMSSHPGSLWAALGRPALRGPLPPSRGPEWRLARERLAEALRTHGVTQRIRSPGALWSLLRSTVPPAAATWAALLGQNTLHDLIRSIPASHRPEARLVSWNLRWLVSPRADQAAAKRALVRRWLETGRVVLLQETHWSEADIAVWQTSFPAATVLASAAAAGPRGGPQGGVAILLPAEFQVTSRAELVPGFALEAHVTHSTRPAMRLVSVYLPLG